jgi:tetratricopeptide (TPR) repeat protein
MNTTTTPSYVRPGFLLIALFLCVASASAQTAAERVEQIDQWFVSLKGPKKTVPQATLQTWVQAQEALRDLDAIAHDRTTDSATAWRAHYVAAYGLWMLELYDVSAGIARELAARASDDRQRALALKDLAQALENAGRFAESADESARMIAATAQPGLLEYNNHALRLLKAGRYDECLAYVNRIELNEKAAHTRIFSARAHAYRGRYDSAKAELTKACELGEQAACSMLDKLESETPEKYWTDDRAFRMQAWRPYNSIDSALALAAIAPSHPDAGAPRISGFAPSFWFNEIHALYPSLEAGEEIRPTYPAMLPKGRVGVMMFRGVPIVSILIDESVDGTTVDKGVAAYVASLHGPSAFGDQSMKLATRALVNALPKSNGGGHSVIIVHTDWQEQLVRAGSESGARYRVIAPR